MEHTTLEIDDVTFPSEQQEQHRESSDGEVLGEISAENESPPPKQTISSSWLSILTLEYYQSLFDVSTRQVVIRTFAGMVPVYWILVDSLGMNPDLYGPFWLAITLILTTAVSGNISRLSQNSSTWEFHFEEVTQLGTAVFAYIWIVPACIWAVLWWRGNRQKYTLLQLLAIYGYSMGIFIPLSVLWVINNEVLRWVLLVVGCALSGGVLLRSLWKPLSTDSRTSAVVILVVVLLLHACLSIGFKFFYFALVPGDMDILTQTNENETVNTESFV